MTLDDYHSDLYVAGFFDRIGDLKTLNVARVHDLKTFAPLDQGVGSSTNNTHGVQDMAVYGNELYVGGLFADASGVDASNLARWNGENWSDAGVGTDGLVEGLLPANIGDGHALYVAGFFGEVGTSMWARIPPEGIVGSVHRPIRERHLVSTRQTASGRGPGPPSTTTRW